MEMAGLLFARLLSLFFIILIGFVTVRCGLVQQEGIKSLSMLSLYIICPFAVMNAFEVNPTREILGGLLLAVLFAMLTHVIFIGAMRLLKRPLKLQTIERASIIYSNAGILTIPLVTALFGPDWVIYTCAYNVVQITLQWTHLRHMISGEKGVDLKKILLNPNLIAIYVGVIIFFTGFRFPGPIDQAIDMVAAMVGPVGMLISGMTIGGMTLKKVVSFRRVWLVTVLRMLVMPLIMALIARVLGLASLVPNGQTVLLISLLAAAGPSGATVMQMSRIYNDSETADYAGAINVITMLCCAITMPLVAAFFLM
ncbi:MAG: AEC family transporter [Oscillospiraceae bacterium]|nr:AEC family transporter [Oscillospiraceae bacterium]